VSVKELWNFPLHVHNVNSSGVSNLAFDGQDDLESKNLEENITCQKLFLNCEEIEEWLKKFYMKWCRPKLIKFALKFLNVV